MHGPAALSLIAAVAGLAAGPAHAAPRTLALFVVAGDGGPGRTTLSTAPGDAARLRDTLGRLGGLAPDDARLLVDPTPDAVLFALGDLEARAREAVAAGHDVTLLLWCAGHLADGAVRLGARGLELRTLEALLQTSPATRRLGLFDLVGPASEEPSPRLSFETRGVPGLALFSSVAAGPDAWASSLTGTSHFAFHLVNALRGAADADADGAVALPELVTWVAARARAPVPGLPAEAWPPLTSLGGGGLALSPSVAPGLYVVADRAGLVAGELEKGSGAARLVLPAGRYVVRRRVGEGLRLAEVDLSERQMVQLEPGLLLEAPASRDPVRRDQGASLAGRHWSLSAGADYRIFTDAALPSSPLLGAELTLHQVFLGGLAFALDGGYGWSSGALSPALVGAVPWSASLTTVGLSARFEWFRDGRLVPFAGVRLELDLLTRAFADPSWATQTYTTLAPGAVAGLTVRLGLGLSIVARARVQYVSLAVDAPRGLAAADLGLQLRYEFGG